MLFSSWIVRLPEVTGENIAEHPSGDVVLANKWEVTIQMRTLISNSSPSLLTPPQHEESLNGNCSFILYFLFLNSDVKVISQNKILPVKKPNVPERKLKSMFFSPQRINFTCTVLLWNKELFSSRTSSQMSKILPRQNDTWGALFARGWEVTVGSNTPLTEIPTNQFPVVQSLDIYQSMDDLVGKHL